MSRSGYPFQGMVLEQGMLEIGRVWDEALVLLGQKNHRGRRSKKA
jgi:hypothetical protein